MGALMEGWIKLELVCFSIRILIRRVGSALGYVTHRSSASQGHPFPFHGSAVTDPCPVRVASDQQTIIISYSPDGPARPTINFPQRARLDHFAPLRALFTAAATDYIKNPNYRETIE